MGLLKLCSRCNGVIEQGNTMCDECSKKSKRRHTDYDKTARNKESAKIYNTKQWREERHKVKVRDLYMCMPCYFNKRIKSVHTVHHIIPVEDDVKRKFIYDPLNLVSVCQACHLKIHATYDKSKYEKESLQEKLREMIKTGVGEG